MNTSLPIVKKRYPGLFSDHKNHRLSEFERGFTDEELAKDMLEISNLIYRNMVDSGKKQADCIMIEPKDEAKAKKLLGRRKCRKT